MPIKNNKLTAHVIAVAVVVLLPYALFGKNKKLSGWIAFMNGIQISLALFFLEPLFLVPNPFLSIFACSPIWKRMTHAKK